MLMLMLYINIGTLWYSSYILIFNIYISIYVYIILRSRARCFRGETGQCAFPISTWMLSICQITRSLHLGLGHLWARASSPMNDHRWRHMERQVSCPSETRKKGTLGESWEWMTHSPRGKQWRNSDETVTRQWRNSGRDEQGPHIWHRARRRNERACGSFDLCIMHQLTIASQWAGGEEHEWKGREHL